MRSWRSSGESGSPRKFPRLAKSQRRQYAPAITSPRRKPLVKGRSGLSSKLRSILPFFCRFLRLERVPGQAICRHLVKKYTVLTTLEGSPANARLMRALYDGCVRHVLVKKQAHQRCKKGNSSRGSAQSYASLLRGIGFSGRSRPAKQ